MKLNQNTNVMNENLEQLFAAEAIPHLKDLYRTAVRLTRSPAQAEDIVQEVFLQAWKSFGKYEPGTNCRAWLHKIMFFKISHQRRNFAIAKKLFQDDDDEGTIMTQAVSAPIVSKDLSDEDIIAAIDGLSTNYRAVLLLVDVEEFSYQETADILQIPIGTVMSRLSRARLNLRKALAEVAPQYGFKAVCANFSECDSRGYA